MPPQTNPYRPVADPPQADGAQDVLVFDGIIQEADYFAFFPLRGSSLLLLWILVALVSLITVMMTGLVVWELVTEAFDPVALTVIPVILLMMFLVALLFWSLHPRSRARRQLRRSPDLLGRARGTFDTNGLTFFDGQQTHWFSPTALATAGVNSNGIRVPVDLNPYRYLALSSRLFGSVGAGYSKNTAASLASHWKSHQEETIDLRTFQASALEPPLGPEWPLPSQPESCVRFAGEIILQSPTQTPEFRKRAIIESAAMLVSLVAAIILFGFGYHVIAFACLVPAIMGLVNSIRLWRSYLRNTQTEQVWRQLGWIGADEFVWRSESRGIRCPLDQIENVSLSREIASLEFSNGVTHVIPRQQVPDEEDWNELANLLDRYTSKISPT